MLGNVLYEFHTELSYPGTALVNKLEFPLHLIIDSVHLVLSCCLVAQIPPPHHHLCLQLLSNIDWPCVLCCTINPGYSHSSLLAPTFIFYLPCPPVCRIARMPQLLKQSHQNSSIAQLGQLIIITQCDRLGYVTRCSLDRVWEGWEEEWGLQSAVIMRLKEGMHSH